MKGRRFTTAGMLLSVSALALHSGWGRGERPWREATGFDRVPRSLRPPSDLPWPAAAGPPPRLAWLGHAGFLLEWQGARLLVDPNLSPRCAVARRRIERTIAAEQLGPIDAVLLTHAHYDHLDRPTLAALERVDHLLLPAGSEAYVDGLRPDARVAGIAAWASVPLAGLEIVGVPAFHHGHRHHPLASSKQALGWVVRAGGGAIYFAGDTGAANDFAAIGERFHPAIAVLPIGAYAPSWPIGRVHLSPEQAVDAAVRLGRPLVVPAHFGSFALSLDRPAAALPRFARAAARGGIEWRMPRLARPAGAAAGES